MNGHITNVAICRMTSSRRGVFGIAIERADVKRSGVSWPGSGRLALVRLVLLRRLFICSCTTTLAMTRFELIRDAHLVTEDYY